MIMGMKNRAQKALSFYEDKGDLMICISSSGGGSLKNIINGANFAKQLALK
jgi:phosphoheptose isomerase